MRTAGKAAAWAACVWLLVPAALAQDAEQKPGGVYYQEPQNLCDELGGAPECPPGGAPVDPAKAREPQQQPEIIYEPPAETAAPATPGEDDPKAYRELESDCEKSGWGGAPSCD